jgi:hypothetical protein
MLALLAVGAAAMLGGCTAQTPSGVADEPPSTTVSPSAGSESSPVIFAFVCDGVEYTTYAAVWEARQASCTSVRLTGTVPSRQQAGAVAVAAGELTLPELAARCAETGTGVWTGRVSTDRQARVAEALVRYCPGHPEAEHVIAELDAHAG